MRTKSLRRPIVMYNITADCQLRCRHCYNESGGRNRYSPSSEELFRNTRKISEIAGAINFTGGEPFLRPELPDLLALSSSYGVDNIITTNGLRFMERDASELLDMIQEDVYMLKIGMMGATEETNDFVRGRGHFETAMRSLDLLANFDLVSCMKVSLDKHNMGEIEAFVRRAYEHDVGQIVFGQLVDIGRASKMLSDLALNHDEMLKVNDNIREVRKAYPDVKISRHCTLSGLCSVPGQFYTVTARGGVSPCLMREDRAIGDIATEDITKIFDVVDIMRADVESHPSVNSPATNIRYLNRKQHPLRHD